MSPCYLAKVVVNARCDSLIQWGFFAKALFWDIPCFRQSQPATSVSYEEIAPRRGYAVDTDMMVDVCIQADEEFALR